MKNKIIYFLAGLALIFASYCLRITSIDPTTLKLIEEVEDFDTNQLWQGFEMSSYTKDIWYNFNKEFRYEDGKITEKKPDNPVVSIEALKLNGRPLIKAIPYSKFKSVYEQMGGAIDNREIYYKSVFVHESFHCYQMNHGLDLVHDLSEGDREVDGDYDQFMAAVEELDNDKTFKKLWEDEYMGLLSLYEHGDPDSYKKAKNKKESYIKNKFPEIFDDIMFYDSYKQFIEGTAQLVQDKYIGAITGDEEIKYEDRVFYKLERTYYVEGSLKARVLDKYFKNWRENLSFAEDNNLDLMMERGHIL